MKKRSKNYLQWKEKYWNKKELSFLDCLNILKNNKLEKFDTTLNITYHLNLNTKKNEHNVKGFYTLPNAKSKDVKIVVFTKDHKSDILPNEVFKIGGIELIDEIKKTKKIDFDVVIATPEIMNNLGQIASILGPRKLMPSVKHGTVTRNLKPIIDEYKKGKRTFATDGSKSVHFVLGSLNESTENLQENYLYIFEKINKIRPKSIKGKYIKGIHVSTTMSPGFKINLS